MEGGQVINMTLPETLPFQEDLKATIFYSFLQHSPETPSSS